MIWKAFPSRAGYLLSKRWSTLHILSDQITYTANYSPATKAPSPAKSPPIKVCLTSPPSSHEKEVTAQATHREDGQV